MLQPDQGEHGHDKRRLHRTHETRRRAGEHRQGRFVQQGTRPPGARRRKAGVPGVRRGVAGTGGPDGPAGGARTRVFHPARGRGHGHVLPDDGRHRGQSVRVAAGGPVDGGDVRRGHQPRAQVHGERDHDRQREPAGVSGSHRAVRRLRTVSETVQVLTRIRRFRRRLGHECYAFKAYRVQSNSRLKVTPPNPWTTGSSPARTPASVPPACPS
mmetsp:Transcript_2451/g.9933  ORF Transcript_2451/g.9933 Transcript_2451/m.9933 type:complete len:213 (+) Transcript_2451:738-1376(+)